MSKAIKINGILMRGRHSLANLGNTSQMLYFLNTLGAVFKIVPS